MQAQVSNLSPMLYPQIAGRRDWSRGLIFTVCLAAALATGFLPTAQEAFRFLATTGNLSVDSWATRIAERLAFPCLAALFYFSLPRKKAHSFPQSVDWLALIELSVLPILFALIFGWLGGGPSLFAAWPRPEVRLAALWYLFCVPLGEECLFRGWLYEIIDRLWPCWGSATNPLPLAVYFTSIAFSLWHLQNAGHDPWQFVVLQVGYTGLTGIWLGYLRWKSGQVFPCVLAHLGINAAASAF
jgi:membrane protease YdiL (CAAX protease family)